MTVAQLIDRLRKCEPSALVVLATDAEGNSYSPLADLHRCADLSDEPIRCTTDQRNSLPDAVVLWPQ